jgi:peptide/nickel transport system substrate-binding protein
MTIQMSSDIVNFDPQNSFTLNNIFSAWDERLFSDNWTINPSAYDYITQYRPAVYLNGQLAESWEFTDPYTIVFHLRQNVYWQNIAPSYGRQFTSSDVVAKYTRILGGATVDTAYQQIVSVTAIDKYTVAFKWKTANPENMTETLGFAGRCDECIEDPDAVAAYGNLNNWHNAIGTGPFILTDFVDTSSATLTKNPNYWGYDERYPQNKLPYINTLNILIIPNVQTALAAMRSGKIDEIDKNTLQTAQSMKQSNPDINQIVVPAPYGCLSLDMKNDVKPFNDPRVRQAMQMAIDLPTLASTYYGGAIPGVPQAMVSTYIPVWSWPYNQWPASLQAQYAYNPTAAKQLLAAAGYPNGFNTDIVVDAPSDMNLMQIVQSYLAAINVNMAINVMDAATWASYVQTGHKEDQMASRSTGGKRGKTVEPFSEFTSQLSYNGSDYGDVDDPVFDSLYLQALACTTVPAAVQVVQQANQELAEQQWTVSLLQPPVYDLVQPWLKGYNGEDDALSGSYGPSFLFFYPARFWIDQNLK